MGFPVFPNICTGLLPMLIVNIAILIARLKRMFCSFMQYLGFMRQSQMSIASDFPASYVVFPEENDLCSGLLLTSLSEEIRRSLPLTIYNSDEVSDYGGFSLDNTECSVCLAEFQKGQEIHLLPQCRHFFHKCCLGRWLDHMQTTCPLCRASLVPEEIAKKQQRREQELSEELVFWFSGSGFHGSGFQGLWCHI